MSFMKYGFGLALFKIQLNQQMIIWIMFSTLLTSVKFIFLVRISNGTLKIYRSLLSSKSFSASTHLQIYYLLILNLL